MAKAVRAAHERAALDKAAEAAVGGCLALKAGEKFLIISNPDTEQAIIAEALKTAAERRGIETTLLLQPVKSQSDYAEDFVLEALAAKPDACASVSAEKLGKDKYRLAEPLEASDGRKYDHIFTYLIHGAKQMRSFWSPGVTIDIFSRTVAIDYSLMRSRGRALSALLDRAAGLNISSPGGTDIFIGAAGRKALADDGDFSLPGSGGNLPAGEVFISPALKSAEGEIVFDGSVSDLSGTIVIQTPIRCSVAGGFVMECAGGSEARSLEKALRKGMDMASVLAREGMAPEKALSYATNARHIGEFGIGLNAEARITGKMLEDEKVYGTCHFAIGSNYDEDAPAMIHLDGLVKRPTIIALMDNGGELLIMDKGELTPEASAFAGF